MAGRKPNIAVGIIADTREFERAMDKAAGKIGTFRNTVFANLASSAITAGLSAVSSAIDAAFDFGKQGLENYDRLGDASALVNSNFKGLDKTVTGMDLSKLGFDQIATSEAAVKITSTAKALGLTATEARNMTPGLVEASAAYAMLTGAEPQAAAGLFAKALAGNSKAAKELGVEFTKGMTPSERYAAVMAKYGPLAEEAATGTRSLADEQATFDAQMSNIQTTVGGFLNEALTPLMAGINEGLFPALKDLSAKYGPDVKRIIDTLGIVFGKVFTFVQKEVAPIVVSFGGTIGKALGPALAAVKDTMKKWEPIFRVVWDFIKTTVVPILRDFLIPLMGKFFTSITTIVGIVGTVLYAAFKKIEPVLRTVGDILRTVIGFLQDVIDKVTRTPIIKDFLGFIGAGPGKSGGYGRIAAGGARTAAVAGSVVNVTVTQANPDAVVAAISRYARVNGSTTGFARTISR